MPIDNLVDILKSRNITSIGYFHTDHFEPWSKGTGQQYRTGVERFQQQARKSRFGRRMSLFYLNFIPAMLVEPGDTRALSGDRIGFGTMADADWPGVCSVMRPMEAEFGHEMHLHIHHERWVRNTGNYEKSMADWINAHSSAAMDSRRLDRFVGIALNGVSAEIGRPMNDWAFVHGNWALNGSDTSICMIEDEIDILMRHGCWGDFTFPAGRGHCDPTLLHEPYSCLPAHGIKIYDKPESAPSVVERGVPFHGDGRFLIWSSRIKASHSSIDYYSETNRTLFRTPEKMVEAWLRDSVVIDGRLFVKTHAHSLKWEYDIGGSDSPIPHCHPEVVGVFDLFERVADQAQVPIELITVNELRKWLAAPPVQKNNAVLAAPPAPAEAAAAVDTAAPPVIDEAAPASPFNIDEFDGHFTQQVRNWIADVPARIRDAGDFYNRRLQAGECISTYERAIIEKVKATFAPETTRLFEIGIGFGTLSAALAAHGYEVVGYEGANGRAEGARTIAKELTAQYPELAGKYKIVQGFFPDAVDLSSLSHDKKNILIATNIVNSFSADNQDRILRFALNFDEFFFDATRFGITRDREDAERSVSNGLPSLFQDLGLVWADSSSGIRHLRPLPMLTDGDAEAFTPAPAEPNTSDIRALVDELKISARHFLTDIVANGGPDELYQQKLIRDHYIEPYEESVIADILSHHRPEKTHVTEIGTGLGGVALALASLGYKVTAFDLNRRRAAQAQMMLDHWKSEHPNLALDVQIIAQPFPVALPPYSLTGGRANILVSTNIVGSYSAQNIDAILRMAASFDEYILDIGRAGANRNSQEERNAFLAALSRTAFTPQALLYRQGANEYWRLGIKSIINVT